MTQHKIFWKPQLADEFDRVGFIVCDLLDEASIEKVHNVYKTYYPGLPQSWHSDFFSDDLNYRQTVFEEAGSIVLREANKVLINYKPLIGVFVVKEPTEQSRVPLHQDWTMTEPAEAPTINIFLAVTENTLENGCLAVVPGSHHNTDWISAGPHDILSFDNDPTLNTDEFLYPLPLKPGQAIFYDGRLLHASKYNGASIPRISYSMGLVSADSKMIYYHRENNDKGSLRKFRIDSDFLRNYLVGKPMPDAVLLETVPDTNRPITKEQLTRWTKDFDLARPAHVWGFEESQKGS